MLRNILFSLFLLTACIGSQAQIQNYSSSPEQLEYIVNNRARTADAAHKVAAFEEELAPFYHGVSSGDPLTDRIIIWTRVTPEEDAPITVEWRMATDTALIDVVASGEFITDAERDYTVKVDVEGLEAGTTYYYGFTALNANSLTGRCRTAAAGAVDHLRFVIASCNNYQSGYFNGFARIADRNDIDAVIHLGDYIYEYQVDGYGLGTEIDRGHEPINEIIELIDYRTRYAFYRLDADLRTAHQQQTFIHVWDDHETANDSYMDGADNHDPATEGLWEDRKAAANQAFFEWVPIREQVENSIYRSFQYGDLVDLIMTDTRLEGRVEHAEASSDPNLADPSRTMLGEEQYNWFIDELSTSSAQWKLIGNQVVFAPIVTEGLVDAFGPLADILLLDIWEGYPYERDNIVAYIDENEIDNVVYLTGDLHTTVSGDISPNPGDDTYYDPATGMGSIAVEYVTPSISSDGFDETLGGALAGIIESTLASTNPQMKNLDVINHGYMVLDVTTERVQGDYYYVEDVLLPNENESFSSGLFSTDTENYLQIAGEESPGKAIQELQAPADPPSTGVGIGQLDREIPGLVIMGSYPVPANNFNSINYALSENISLTIKVFDLTGKEVATVFSGEQAPGLYTLTFDTANLASGSYLYQFQSDNKTISRKLIIQR